MLTEHENDKDTTGAKYEIDIFLTHREVLVREFNRKNSQQKTEQIAKTTCSVF